MKGIEEAAKLLPKHAALHKVILGHNIDKSFYEKLFKTFTTRFPGNSS